MGRQLTIAEDSTTIDLETTGGLHAAVSIDDLHHPSTGEIGPVLRDRYVLVDRLGSGGKGSVFKALDRYRTTLPEAQQYVAIKILHRTTANREERLASLRREFYRTQTLSHRNIVNVFELDRDGEVDFFTMEFLGGELLSDVLRRLQPLPMSRPQAWKIIGEIAAGLECAHAANIVHADLKPSNIMITDSGDVRILDFGASSNSGEKSPEDPSGPRNALSSVTLAYASCELLEGRAPDPRDDIYALACLSYELLAGVHPFQRRRSTEARDYGIVPMRPPGLSRQQWQVLAMGLCWHRARRPVSVRTWLDKLNIARVAGRLPPARELESSPVRPPLVTSYPATSLLCVLLICVITWVSVAGLGGRKVNSNGLVPAAAASAELNAGSDPTRAGVGLTADSTATDAVPLKTGPVTMPAQTSEAQSQDVKDVSRDIVRLKVPTEPANVPMIFASDCTVRFGDHFAEIRVHRSSRTGHDGPFVWWTEASSAKPGIDYVQQGKAIQSFPRGKSSTSFFVKLVPKASRAHPEVFYVAIASPGHSASSGQIVRSAVWLPSSHDQTYALAEGSDAHFKALANESRAPSDRLVQGMR
jgi:serine/threonine protein kinase